MSEFRVLADRFEQMLAAENISKYSFCLTESEKQELNVENGSFKLMRTVFNNNIALGFTIKPDMRNEFNADVRLILPRLNTVQNLTNDWFYQNVTTLEHRRSDVTWNRENIDGTVSYRHVIRPQRLSFSIKANVSKIWGHRLLPDEQYAARQKPDGMVGGEL